MVSKNQIDNSISGASGSGMFVGSTSPTITSCTLSGSYALGTPASGNLTNCTNITIGSYNSQPIVFRIASGTVSSAQIKTLHATPYELIPAQGANTVIILLAIWGYYIYGTTAYAGGATPTIRIAYGISPTIVTTFFSNAVMTGSVSSVSQVSGQSLASISISSVNSAINFYNSVAAEFTTGDGTINWAAQYIVLTTP